MAAEIEQMLKDLGLQQYRSDFWQAGLDNWEAICKITDSELAVICIRLGHRRKLQREVARRLLWPDFKPLPTTEELLLLLQHNEQGRENIREDYFTLPSSWWSREIACHTATRQMPPPKLPHNSSSTSNEASVLSGDSEPGRRDIRA